MPTFEVQFSNTSDRKLRVIAPDEAAARAHADQRVVRWNDSIGPRGATLKVYPFAGEIVSVVKVKD